MKSFTVYEEYYQLIKCLNDKDRFIIYDAMFKYMFEDKEVQLDGLKNGIWVNIKRPLDKSKNRGKSGSITISNQNEIKMKSNQNQNEIKSKSHQDVNVNVNNYDNNYYVNVNKDNSIYEYIESNFGRTLTPIEYEEISKWEDNELTRYAIKQSILNGAYTIKYINGILQNYKNRNITSVQQAQKEELEYQKRKDKQSKEKGLTAREKRDMEFQELLKKYESEENL